MITTKRIITTSTRHNLIFKSFHHICFLTLFAPLLKPWAETAKLSALSSIEVNLSPRSATLLMLSLIIPTVSSISCTNIVSKLEKVYQKIIVSHPAEIHRVLKTFGYNIYIRLSKQQPWSAKLVPQVEYMDHMELKKTWPTLYFSCFN